MISLPVQKLSCWQTDTYTNRHYWKQYYRRWAGGHKPINHVKRNVLKCSAVAMGNEKLPPTPTPPLHSGSLGLRLSCLQILHSHLITLQVATKQKPKLVNVAVILGASCLQTRDGPKFGWRRTSAEDFSRTFCSATSTLFGRTSLTFGVVFPLTLQLFIVLN